MPLSNAPGPSGFRPDPFVASTDPQASLVNLGPVKTPNFEEFAIPVRALSGEGDALAAQGRREQAAQKYRAAAALCATSAESFAANLRDVFLLKQREFLDKARAMLGDTAVKPTPASPAQRASSMPAPPPQSRKGPPLTSVGGLTDAFSPSVKTPTTTFPYESEDYHACIKYAAKLVNTAEGLKDKDKETSRAAAMFTEASELLEWWGVKRFNSIGDEARQALRLNAQKYAAEAQRLHAGGVAGAAAAANTANGAANTDLAAIEQRVRECIVNDPPDAQVKWADVIGCEDAKNALLATLIDPYVVQQTKKRDKCTGVLLYGPSGTGKTMLVKAVVNLVQELRAEEPDPDADADADADADKASEALTTQQKNGITLITVSMADVNSKWVGEGEKFVRALFSVARKESPAVIFLDEVDALFGERTAEQNQASHAVLNEFLIQADGLNTGDSDVTLLAATNTPWLLDDAIRRRLSSQVEVPSPDPQTRAVILKQKLKKRSYPCVATDAEIEALAKSPLMNNFSGANLKTVVEDAERKGPVRRRHEAKFFVEREGVLWPCEEGTPGCKAGNYLELLYGHKKGRKPGKISFGEPPITLDDLREACTAVPSAERQIAMFAAYRKKLEAARQ